MTYLFPFVTLMSSSYRRLCLCGSSIVESATVAVCETLLKRSRKNNIYQIAKLSTRGSNLWKLFIFLRSVCLSLALLVFFYPSTVRSDAIQRPSLSCRLYLEKYQTKKNQTENCARSQRQHEQRQQQQQQKHNDNWKIIITHRSPFAQVMVFWWISSFSFVLRCVSLPFDVCSTKLHTIVRLHNCQLSIVSLLNSQLPTSLTCRRSNMRWTCCGRHVLDFVHIRWMRKMQMMFC